MLTFFSIRIGLFFPKLFCTEIEYMLNIIVLLAWVAKDTLKGEGPCIRNESQPRS